MYAKSGARSRRKKHERARRPSQIGGGGPRGERRRWARHGVVKQVDGSVRVATAEGLVRAVVDALAAGDMDGAAAAVDALRAFVLALGRLPNRLSDRSVRTPYAGTPARISPIRVVDERLAA